MKTIGIKLNRKKDPDLIFTRKVIGCLARPGVRVLLSAPAEEGVESREGVFFSVLEKDLFSADILLVLGGDGTILSIASPAAKAGIPVLGINLGTVGFMAELEKDQLDQLERLFTGDFFTEERMMLETRLPDDPEPMYSLNECCLSLYHGFHILTADLYSDGERICSMKADGVIFSTPTGSTGYSLSAGGAVVDSSLPSIGVKAICPYLLNNAPHLVFPDSAHLELKHLSTQSGKMYLASDGREEREAGENASISVRRSPYSLRLVRFFRSTNIQTFFKKF